MSSAQVARRYARALLEIGANENLDALVADVTMVAATYESSAELRVAINAPLVTQTAKKAVIGDLCDKLAIGKTARNAMLLLGDRRRFQLIAEIATMLREMNDARKGTMRAEVTSAVPLSDTFYANLQSTLERLSKKRVVLDRKHDPALIGGVVLRVGDLVLDSSIKTQLDGLKQALLPN